MELALVSGCGCDCRLGDDYERMFCRGSRLHAMLRDDGWIIETPKLPAIAAAVMIGLRSKDDEIFERELHGGDGGEIDGEHGCVKKSVRGSAAKVATQ